MATRQEILGMTPRAAYEQAERDGYRRAEKRTVFGFKPDAFSRWLKGRPEYNDQKVLDLVQDGQNELYEEALRRVIDTTPRGGRIFIINASLSGSGVATIEKS